jgi:hypothetical protein
MHLIFSAEGTSKTLIVRSESQSLSLLQQNQTFSLESLHDSILLGLPFCANLISPKANSQLSKTLMSIQCRSVGPAAFSGEIYSVASGHTGFSFFGHPSHGVLFKISSTAKQCYLVAFTNGSIGTQPIPLKPMLDPFALIPLPPAQLPIIRLVLLI